MPDYIIVSIPYINLLNFSWTNKMSFFEEYGAFNINAHSKFGETPLTLTKVIIWKQNIDGQTDILWIDGLADGHTESQHNTLPLMCGRL